MRRVIRRRESCWRRKREFSTSIKPLPRCTRTCWRWISNLEVMNGRCLSRRSFDRSNRTERRSTLAWTRTATRASRRRGPRAAASVRARCTRTWACTTISTVPLELSLAPSSPPSAPRADWTPRARARGEKKNGSTPPRNCASRPRARTPISPPSVADGRCVGSSPGQRTSMRPPCSSGRPRLGNISVSARLKPRVRARVNPWTPS